MLASLSMEQQQDGILPGNPANGGVNTAAFSPDSRLLAASYSDGYVAVVESGHRAGRRDSSSG